MKCGKDGGRDSQGVWDGHGHTAVFNMENQQGPVVQHRGLCSILCDNLYEKRTLKNEYICITEALCCTTETKTTL